jgi:hypothetical protein
MQVETVTRRGIARAQAGEQPGWAYPILRRIIMACGLGSESSFAC